MTLTYPAQDAALREEMRAAATGNGDVLDRLPVFFAELEAESAEGHFRGG